MELLERIEGDTLVVKVLAARLDSASAPDVKRRLAKRIANGHQQLVLDLSEVDFIDSSGLSTLVFALKRLGRYGEMAISSPRDSVVSILRLTRLYRVFNIFPDCQQAIAALRASPENPAALENNQPDRL
jgi:anti-sigma B factor antagonist